MFCPSARSLTAARFSSCTNVRRVFRNVTVIDVEIGPGDLLFLPVGWWHHVRGLDTSITMTFTNFVFDNDFYSIYKTYQDI